LAIVLLTLAAEPIVYAVVNGASFISAGIAPGEIATIFGADLTSARASTYVRPAASNPRFRMSR
jgi:hypothetical protein